MAEPILGHCKETATREEGALRCRMGVMLGLRLPEDVVELMLVTLARVRPLPLPLPLPPVSAPVRASRLSELSAGGRLVGTNAVAATESPRTMKGLGLELHCSCGAGIGAGSCCSAPAPAGAGGPPEWPVRFCESRHKQSGAGRHRIYQYSVARGGRGWVLFGTIVPLSAIVSSMGARPVGGENV